MFEEANQNMNEQEQFDSKSQESLTKNLNKKNFNYLSYFLLWVFKSFINF